MLNQSKPFSYTLQAKRAVEIKPIKERHASYQPSQVLKASQHHWRLEKCVILAYSFTNTTLIVNNE